MRRASRPPGDIGTVHAEALPGLLGGSLDNLWLRSFGIVACIRVEHGLTGTRSALSFGVPLRSFLIFGIYPAVRASGFIRSKPAIDEQSFNAEDADTSRKVATFRLWFTVFSLKPGGWDLVESY